MRSRVSLFCMLGALLAMASTPATLRSFAEGPFPGFTGGFKEPTCQQCHFGNDLNAAGGTLTVTGVPAEYQPGDAYVITVVLEKPGLQKGGFQLTARAASGPTVARDAGSLAALGADVQIVTNAEKTVTYIQHTPAGTTASVPGRLAWKFRWTAPATPVPVEFDAAANASNNDESPMDDWIYATTKTTEARK